ncbi:TerC/Alx family metal homeostasis membrane protein [Gemmatimonas sp.]|uniref:TerC/Alx family metal homeostasis membrane protein n=1 Tax=Gemmatimonas sp. TaxID=1962908 RepID=UPI00391F8464|nr:TerC/Alx family metal homeostasis membrane protein [Gemmatimonadota bacterium]
MTLVAWGLFLVFVFAVLAIDLFVLNKEAHTVSVKEAFAFTGVLAVLALAFSGVVYVAYDQHWLGLGLAVDAIDKQVNDGRLAAVKFLTGYLIELSLSTDNVFVIALIFQHLRIPAIYQHRTLFWGVLGALVMRGALIVVGAQLVARYHWILYLFGAFLVYTAIKLLVQKEPAEGPDETGVVKLIRRFFPVTATLQDDHFTVRLDGRLFLTPLAVALILVETTDLVFALDSIPAIFAITADPFLVFTSNVFAILGLRSLYFALAGAMDKFRYLKISLAVILAVVGLKMLLADVLKDQLGPNANLYLLVLVFLILVAGVVASAVADASAKKLDATAGARGTDAPPDIR